MKALMYKGPQAERPVDPNQDLPRRVSSLFPSSISSHFDAPCPSRPHAALTSLLSSSTKTPVGALFFFMSTEWYSMVATSLLYQEGTLLGLGVDSKNNLFLYSEVLGIENWFQRLESISSNGTDPSLIEHFSSIELFINSSILCSSIIWPLTKKESKTTVKNWFLESTLSILQTGIGIGVSFWQIQNQTASNCIVGELGQLERAWEAFRLSHEWGITGKFPAFLTQRIGLGWKWFR